MTREEAIVEMEKLGMKVSAVTPIFEKADAGATNEERLANIPRVRAKGERRNNTLAKGSRLIYQTRL